MDNFYYFEWQVFGVRKLSFMLPDDSSELSDVSSELLEEFDIGSIGGRVWDRIFIVGFRCYFCIDEVLWEF